MLITIKNLFENGFEILLTICDSYMKKTNTNKEDIKTMLINAYKYVN